MIGSGWSRVTYSGHNAQNLANTVWAFAKLEMREVALTNVVSSNAVSRRASETLEEFNVQNLTNMVWAFAKLEIK